MRSGCLQHWLHYVDWGPRRVDQDWQHWCPFEAACESPRNVLWPAGESQVPVVVVQPQPQLVRLTGGHQGQMSVFEVARISLQVLLQCEPLLSKEQQHHAIWYSTFYDEKKLCEICIKTFSLKTLAQSRKYMLKAIQSAFLIHKKCISQLCHELYPTGDRYITVTVLTSGRPSPALAQLTWARSCFRQSATGDTTLFAGNTGPLHTGHVYPAGAVLAGSCLAYLSRHAQWSTSTNTGYKHAQKSWVTNPLGSY